MNVGLFVVLTCFKGSSTFHTQVDNTELSNAGRTSE
jgi:hypothetical protein